MSLHTFAGQCEPGFLRNHASYATFSVACFELVPKKSGLGVKCGKAKVRVIGPISNPEAVYKKAAEICVALDDGTYAGPKTVRLR